MSEMRYFKDTIPFVYEPQELTESEKKDKKYEGVLLKVRGIFQRGDEKNGNGRIYPTSLWEKVIPSKEVQERIAKRQMLGELEHPKDGETDLKRVSHVITKLWLEGNLVWGESEILDTENGRTLATLLKARTGVGISSRGRGSSHFENNSEIVEDDYVLETFDFVYNPSTKDAYPVISEKVNSIKEGRNMIQKLEDIEQRLNDLNKLIEVSSDPSEIKRYKDEITSLQVQITKAMKEDDTLVGVGEELLESIAEVKKKATAILKNEKKNVEEPKKGEKTETTKIQPGVCPKCENTMSIDLQKKSFVCEKCSLTLPVSAVYTKEELVESYLSGLSLIETLSNKCKELYQSNKKLRERYEASINTIGEMMKQNNSLGVKNYVFALTERYPFLKKWKEMLLKCETTDCVDEKIQLHSEEIKRYVDDLKSQTERAQIESYISYLIEKNPELLKFKSRLLRCESVKCVRTLSKELERRLIRKPTMERTRTILEAKVKADTRIFDVLVTPKEDEDLKEIKKVIEDELVDVEVLEWDDSIVVTLDKENFNIETEKEAEELVKKALAKKDIKIERIRVTRRPKNETSKIVFRARKIERKAPFELPQGKVNRELTEIKRADYNHTETSAILSSLIERLN